MEVHETIQDSQIDVCQIAHLERAGSVWRIAPRRIKKDGKDMLVSNNFDLDLWGGLVLFEKRTSVEWNMH